LAGGWAERLTLNPKPVNGYEKRNALFDSDVFLNPGSVAVIGASERPGSWGSFIMRGLLSSNFPGHIYPVNSRAGQVFGIPAFRHIAQINSPIDLAVCAIPEKFVKETIEACGQKGVKGITVITAGFAETSDQGRQQQASLAGLARSLGIRLIGPNVSGTFNLHAGFNASSIPADDLLSTPIAAACQGGYAFYDILSSGKAKGLGVGKFIHTGNESDLTVTDFLQAFGKDPEVKAIVMYIEALRDGKRFMEIAGEVTRTKPVVVYKAGRTVAGIQWPAAPGRCGYFTCHGAAAAHWPRFNRTTADERQPGSDHYRGGFLGSGPFRLSCGSGFVHSGIQPGPAEGTAISGDAGSRLGKKSA
jgi:succinyl-CoA synthetase alpha subunit